MLVVQPPSARVGSAETTPNEEHLLERLTILENTMGRLAERLEQGLKLLLRQSETAYTNHALVKSLIEVLSECGVVDSDRLVSMWRNECAKLDEKSSESALTHLGPGGMTPPRLLPFLGRTTSTRTEAAAPKPARYSAVPSREPASTNTSSKGCPQCRSKLGTHRRVYSSCP